jgi:hypothetical protein
VRQLGTLVLHSATVLLAQGFIYTNDLDLRFKYDLEKGQPPAVLENTFNSETSLLTAGEIPTR